MKVRFGVIMLFLVSIAVGHVATLLLAPQVIMARAMGAMEARGVPLHAFVLSRRITPQRAAIV